MSNKIARILYLISWGIIAFTVLIIVWGAWVRLSGSGDGCGDHWPLCNGQVIPKEGASKTWIEYLHRISTAIYGVLVIVQLGFLRKIFPKGHPARFWALLTILFTLTEALLGRQLVKSGLVNQSTDISRLFVMPLHLINTSLLLFSCVMTAESIKHGECARHPLIRKEKLLGALYIAVVVIILTTGAIAALGSHLVPSGSLMLGLAHDMASDAHPAVRLRILHPILALTLPVALFIFAQLSTTHPSPSSQTLWYRRLALCTVAALCIGVATLTLLAPLWLKITHLLMTNGLIILSSLCIFHTLRSVPIPRR